MKKMILFSIFHLLVSLSKPLACNCGGFPTFCETIVDADGNMRDRLVIRGTILKEKDDGVEVRVDNLLLGTLGEGEIFIRSGYGIDCGEVTSDFSKDESYIFTLYQDYPLSDKIYWLSICEISYLKIENEIIKGAIAPGVESLPFEDLPTLEKCGSGLNLFSLKTSLSVFPNPTLNFISIKNLGAGEHPTLTQAMFIDVLGRIIRAYQKTNGWQAGEEWMIDATELAAGVYFLKIYSGSQEVVFRVVKQ